MSFVSWGYFLFLACTVIAYYIVPRRFRWIALLAASFVFCACISVYSTIWLAATTVFSYAAARFIARRVEEGRQKEAKTALIGSLVLLFGSLLLMKYVPLLPRTAQGGLNKAFNVTSIVAPIASLAGARIRASIVMPVGISFYLFQVTGYLIDVYRQKTAFVEHFGHYSLAVSFFAKLSQGPITPVEKLVRQFAGEAEASAQDRSDPGIDPIKMRRGAVRILFGLVKKAVIADRLAVVANSVFANPSGMSATSAIIGAVFYTFQLYADFAGYTDVAIGSAQLFGIELPENFRRPYLARSIAEFWRRWHITLSDWLKTYVYFPLGGSRVSKYRWAVNVLTVFLISGVWHGSGLTFIVWGLLHGCYQVAGKAGAGARAALRERYLRGAGRLAEMLQGGTEEPAKNELKERYLRGANLLADGASVVVTFVLAAIAWVFFRADSMAGAMAVFARLGCGDWTFSLQQLGVEANEWSMSWLVILLLVIADLISERRSILDWVEERVLPVRWLVYLGFLYALIFFGIYGSISAQSFIYVSF